MLGDRYRLDEFVASGGMGQVFRATDKTLNRTVAVKVLLPGLTSDAEFGSRFRAEARIMASIGHKGVVGVYDYGETPEGTMFLVMAFVEGRPLGERITREGGLSAAETMAIVAQAADALHAAHSNGIIHRDVKPNNLLVGDNGAVTLVDFGVARSSNVTSVTKVNAVIGTALYMSPEQASGKPIAPSTDIYALGAVAYHCLTGGPPFTGNSPLEIAIKHLQDDPAPLPQDLPGSVRALVERAMEKDPADRFATAAALADAARTAAQDQTLPDQRPGVAAVSIGTSGALRVLVEQPVTDPQGRVFCYELSDERWVVGGAINNGGVVLDWVADALAPDLGEHSQAELLDLAGQVPAGSEGLVMLPYLLSERAPHWSAVPRGAYVGLMRHHGRGHLVRAAVEGVCQQLAVVLGSVRDAGNEIREVRATGGFARSELWRQMLTDALGTDVGFPQSREGSAFGAALLGMQALGLVESIEVAAELVQIDEVCHPGPDADAYARQRPVFAALYDALEPAFRALGESGQGD